MIKIQKFQNLNLSIIIMINPRYSFTSGFTSGLDYFFQVQSRLPQSGPIFQKVKTNFTCPDESSLFRSKTDANKIKSTNQKPATHTESETSSNPGNPFGDFDDDDDATSSGGNPFGEPDEPEIEEIDTSGTSSGLTSGDSDERRIQIRFLEKEIRKLKIKKDFEQAEIISQVLREIIDS